MIIIRNHFELEDTYIVGDIIVNGCQVFHVSKLSSICEKFRVSDKIKDQVLVAHRGNRRIPENYDKLVESKDWCVRAAVAATGIKEYCDKLVGDKDWRVRAAVARLGIKEYSTKLLKDEEEYVRTVADIYFTV